LASAITPETQRPSRHQTAPTLAGYRHPTRRKCSMIHSRSSDYFPRSQTRLGEPPASRFYQLQRAPLAGILSSHGLAHVPKSRSFP
jgi:hypothetical protein